MAIVAVTHVIVSHFAIGGGLIIAVTETLAVRRGDDELRDLARRSSLVLILVSTVFGAISGVGIWVVTGLISPAAISALIHTYVWGWAIEWVFFFVEIVAALVYYTAGRSSKRTHLMVVWIYFVAAYLSSGGHQRHHHLHADARRLAREPGVLGRFLQPHLLAVAGAAHRHRHPHGVSPSWCSRR